MALSTRSPFSSSGDLIAAGEFSVAGGVSAARIARWDGAAWNPMGSGANGTIHAITLLPGGDIVIGGQFSVAGGQLCSEVARWTPPPLPVISAQPTDHAACPSAETTFSVTASGNGPLTYQWQAASYAHPSVWSALTDGDATIDGEPFANVSGSLTSALTARAFIGQHINTHVRCVVANPCGGVTSHAATLSHKFLRLQRRWRRRHRC